MAEHPRPDDWDAVEIAANTKGYTALREEIANESGTPTLESYEALLVEAGADAIYPFALEKGKAELIKLIEKEFRVYDGSGSQVGILTTRKWQELKKKAGL